MLLSLGYQDWIHKLLIRIAKRDLDAADQTAGMSNQPALQLKMG